MFETLQNDFADIKHQLVVDLNGCNKQVIPENKLQERAKSFLYRILQLCHKLINKQLITFGTDLEF